MSTAIQQPVSWDEGIGAFRISGFAEATTVLRGDGWSSDPQRNPLVVPEMRDMPPGNLLFTDPPRHTRLRGLLNPAFTPRGIEALRSRVVAVVDAVLDGIREIGPEFDVLADVSYPVTLAVIAELLDVGVEGAYQFALHTPKLVRLLEIDATREEVDAALDASTEVALFLTPIFNERLRAPGEDFISALLALQAGVDGLGLDEVLATCITLLAAGHETTANLIANSTLALIDHPEQLPHLMADPAVALEELLRLEGPAKLAARVALTDHHLGGRQILAGQAVVVDVMAANRDPHKFPEPLRLDLTRTPSGHLGFGAGAHFCLGAALARLEATVTLSRLFARYPDLALTDALPRWRDSTTFRALEELWVHTGL